MARYFGVWAIASDAVQMSRHLGRRLRSAPQALASSAGLSIEQPSPAQVKSSCASSARARARAPHLTAGSRHRLPARTTLQQGLTNGRPKPIEGNSISRFGSTDRLGCRLRCEHSAADELTLAKVLERGARLLERPSGNGNGGDRAGAGELNELA